MKECRGRTHVQQSEVYRDVKENLHRWPTNLRSLGTSYFIVIVRYKLQLLCDSFSHIQDPVVKICSSQLICPLYISMMPARLLAMLASNKSKKATTCTGFDLEGILHKYIWYALNEKPFNPDMVADLIQLRRASMLNDSQVADILNEIS